jgi:hypothetical protein
MAISAKVRRHITGVAPSLRIATGPPYRLVRNGYDSLGHGHTFGTWHCGIKRIEWVSSKPAQTRTQAIRQTRAT